MKTKIVRKTRYEQIADILRDEILSGKFKKNSRFYSESQLSTLFETTHVTIRNALHCLQEEGLIIRIHGKGTFVRSPAVKKEMLIGIVVSSIAEGIYPELVFAMEETAQRLGYSVLLCNSQNDFSKEQVYAQRLIAKKVDGVIFDPILSTTHYERNVACVSKFLRNQIPVVTIGHLPDTKNVLDYDHVDIDNMGVYKIICHLIQMGHKRIGVVSEPFSPNVEERIEGYKKALRENNIEFNPDLVKPARFELWDKREPETVKAFLKMKNGPTAIFAIHDVLAQFVIKVLLSESVRIPEDIAVAGFDDLAFSAALAVPLTTVRWSRADLGRISVEMLIERMEGKRPEAKHITLPTALVIRESCSLGKSRELAAV